jgi:hypothetical protein
MRLHHFLHASLPPIPPVTSYRFKADPVLRSIYGNDELGDCVPAGFAHLVGLTTANAERLYAEALAQVISDYSAIGGYVPGHPETDQGCDEETALNYYTQHGFADGTKILGWLSVDGTSRDEVAAAMYLFENLVFGVEMPDAWIEPFPSKDGFVWNIAGEPDEQNGHCFVGVDNDPRGIVIDTWGIEGIITWQAIARYCSRGEGGQLFTYITSDQLVRGQQRAPNGLSWSDLIVAFDHLGGNIPVPTPPPLPPPPAPSGPVTLAQAQAWVTAAVQHMSNIVHRHTAEFAIRAELAKHWPH